MLEEEIFFWLRTKQKKRVIKDLFYAIKINPMKRRYAEIEHEVKKMTELFPHRTKKKKR